MFKMMNMPSLEKLKQMISAYAENKQLQRLLKGKASISLNYAHKELTAINSKHTDRLLCHELNMIEIRKCNMILKEIR